jgi:hypothetical protein
MSAILPHGEIKPPHGGIKIRLPLGEAPIPFFPGWGPRRLDHNARRDAPLSFAQRLKIFRFTAGFGGSGGFPSRRIQQWDLILCGEIRLSRAKIGAALEAGGASQWADLDPVVLSIEAKLRRTGKGKRLLIENGSKAEFNANLAAMITEAFAIRNQLLSGSDTNIEAMTERVGITKGRLASLVRLSYLAPDIVRALLDGLQPIELTPTRLIRLSKDLPHEWSEQRHFLGFGEGRSMSSDRNAL